MIGRRLKAALRETEAVKRNLKFIYRYIREESKTRSPAGTVNVDGELLEKTQLV